MDDLYSPYTGEYIPPLADPPDWIARSGVPRPDYDPAAQSPFWCEDHWEVRDAALPPDAENP